MKRALTLSGGGARGAYQVGVWKALRELNIKYDIVTGTSVGALNGAFMVQDNFDIVKDFWFNIDFKEVFTDIFFKDENLINKKNKIIKKYINSAIFKKGLEVSSLEDNLTNHLDENLFYKSKIDYGLVTYDLKNRKPVMLRKKDIPHAKLKDYIIASATLFPIFKKKKIDDNYYIDGGYYDNLPINLAIDMGATEVIAVHIGVFGKRRPVKNKNIQITYIEPKSNLGFPAFFDKNVSMKNFDLGYNDTMKVYGKYEGKIYTFKNKEISTYYENSKNDILEVLSSISKFKIDITYNDFVNYLEFTGKLFNIDESKIYTMEQYNKLLMNEYFKFDEKNKLKKLRTLVFNNRKSVLKEIYLDLLDNKSNMKKTSRLSIIYPRVTMTAIYLYLLFKNRL